MSAITTTTYADQGPAVALATETRSRARRLIHRRAHDEHWTDTALDDILTMLGLDQPTPQPTPEPPTPPSTLAATAPADTDDDDGWWSTTDVRAEADIPAGTLDSWLKHGLLTHTAFREPGGTITPVADRIPSNARPRRLWTLGDVHAACRMSWLATHRHTLGRLDLRTCAALARMGHTTDLTPTTLTTVPWRHLADLALAAEPLPGWPGHLTESIWQTAIHHLGRRAHTIAEDLTDHTREQTPA